MLPAHLAIIWPDQFADQAVALPLLARVLLASLRSGLRLRPQPTRAGGLADQASW